MSYLDFFCADDESTAVHEAGHAVAAIRAGWQFSHIEINNGLDPDTTWLGRFVWHPDYEIAWDMKTPLYVGMHKGDEAIRRSLVIHSLAGAVAERILCCEHDLKEFPSGPDVSILEETWYYPLGTRFHLYEWGKAYQRSATRESELEALLDAIFAADMPTVEAFVIENQYAIGDVACALFNSDNWSLSYDEIRAIVEAADEAKRAV